MAKYSLKFLREYWAIPPEQNSSYCRSLLLIWWPPLLLKAPPDGLHSGAHAATKLGGLGACPHSREVISIMFIITCGEAISDERRMSTSHFSSPPPPSPGKYDLPGNSTSKEMWLSGKSDFLGNATSWDMRLPGNTTSWEIWLPRKSIFS